jgi:hypothetical protein
LYKDIVDFWLFIDNSKTDQELIAEGREHSDVTIYNQEKWVLIQKNIQDENN